MVRLKTDKTSVCVDEMKDGDIAVITRWSCGEYTGRVVQRYRDYLIAVGADAGKGFGKFFVRDNNNPTCFVHILELGDELIV